MTSISGKISILTVLTFFFCRLENLPFRFVAQVQEKRPKILNLKTTKTAPLPPMMSSRQWLILREIKYKFLSWKTEMLSETPLHSPNLNCQENSCSPMFQVETPSSKWISEKPRTALFKNPHFLFRPDSKWRLIVLAMPLVVLLGKHSVEITEFSEYSGFAWNQYRPI